MWDLGVIGVYILEATRHFCTVAYVEEAYQKSVLERKHLDTIGGKKLKNISSIAFGGPDLKTVFLGCLLGNQIASFKSNISGLKPSHWERKKLLNKNYYLKNIKILVNILK